ncbi:hypothetical protein VaNZ11_009432 [Volvox africanus]|uniref:Fe2OG dioxygenase domain-containing protein n=1 Tax=Volvox africanus TaxID=51714 RepID=A0ABQ5S8Q0_9CHLO|nr:hypothetical protein VaNZ11_009432 [Volvox africanus]
MESFTHAVETPRPPQEQAGIPSSADVAPTITASVPSASPNPLNLRPIATHATSWRPTDSRVTLNVTFDACIVPDATGAARVDKAHLVVLDNFIGEAERTGLLDFITHPGWNMELPPPSDKWDRGTRDSATACPTWGLRDEWLRNLATNPLPARLEVQSRLQRLYPDYVIAHMPSDKIQIQTRIQDTAARQDLARNQIPADDANEEAAPPGSIVDCNQFVANAATFGDTYSWHVDADPSTLPYPSPWTLAYGQYVNREPGRPLFVSLLLYLNHSWERDWQAETLFLDTPSDCGVVVRPKTYRAVLLDQDILHRLIPPSRAAMGRPRYSLVWKLVMLPRQPGHQPTLARRAWGRPTPFGSAAALERVVSGLSAAKAAEADLAMKAAAAVGATAAEAERGAAAEAGRGAAAEAGGPVAGVGAAAAAAAPSRRKRRKKQKSRDMVTEGQPHAATAATAGGGGGGGNGGLLAAVSPVPKPTVAKKRRRQGKAAADRAPTANVTDLPGQHGAGDTIPRSRQEKVEGGSMYDVTHGVPLKLDRGIVASEGDVGPGFGAGKMAPDRSADGVTEPTGTETPDGAESDFRQVAAAAAEVPAAGTKKQRKLQRLRAAHRLKKELKKASAAATAATAAEAVTSAGRQAAAEVAGGAAADVVVMHDVAADAPGAGGVLVID